MDLSDALKSATIKIRDRVEAGTLLAPDPTVIPEVDPIVGAFFALEEPDARDVEQVDEIKGWLTAQGHTTDDAIVTALKELRMRFGSDATLEKVHQYVRLRKQASTLTKAAEAMEQ